MNGNFILFFWVSGVFIFFFWVIVNFGKKLIVCGSRFFKNSFALADSTPWWVASQVAAGWHLTWRNPAGLPNTTRINLKEPGRVASPTRINLEEP